MLCHAVNMLALAFLGFCTGLAAEPAVRVQKPESQVQAHGPMGRARMRYAGKAMDTRHDTAENASDAMPPRAVRGTGGQPVVPPELPLVPCEEGPSRRHIARQGETFARRIRMSAACSCIVRDRCRHASMMDMQMR